MDNQPTNDELEAAFDDCCLTVGLGASFTENLIKLRNLYNKRHTWFGEYEVELMHRLDKYLAHYG